MRREFCVVLVMVLALLWSGCNKSPTSPTSTTSSTAVANPAGSSATRLTISGNGSLTTIGETSQLTAMATFSDGTLKDVTRDANTTWTSNDPSVITVSSNGLLTVVALGSTSISVSYRSTNFSTGSGKTVTATPIGTFVIAGFVREPGQSGVPSVRVTETASGRVVQTNQNGNYSVAQLASNQAHLRFEKDGYEPVELDATSSNAEVAIQRIIRLAAGDTVTPLQLAPHDLSYIIGTDHCYPCRLVRVTVRSAGTVHIRVTWTASATLDLWAGGQFFAGAPAALTADVPVTAPGEVIMYLGSTLPAGATGLYVPFTIATAPPS